MALVYKADRTDQQNMQPAQWRAWWHVGAAGRRVRSADEWQASDGVLCDVVGL
jgi:hypothetical protein